MTESNNYYFDSVNIEDEFDFSLIKYEKATPLITKSHNFQEDKGDS